jgi:hypothetical protein
MTQYLVQFEHDSKFMGMNGFGTLLITATSFELACIKVITYSLSMKNSATGFEWLEKFTNPRNFVNLTIE